MITTQHIVDAIKTNDTMSTSDLAQFLGVKSTQLLREYRKDIHGDLFPTDYPGIRDLKEIDSYRTIIEKQGLRVRIMCHRLRTESSDTEPESVSSDSGSESDICRAYDPDIDHVFKICVVYLVTLVVGMWLFS